MLFVFLVLAAQYESWALPLAIILIVPMCLLSAIGGVWLRNFDNNILTQIGFVVLVGLACKNAILIVEFAQQIQHRDGKNRFDAAVEACRLRLRPILMTSFAFILGVLPLVISHGSGAEMRQALGTAVFAGMLGVTFFGLFLTPVFYVVIMWFKERGSRNQCLNPAGAETKSAVSAPNRFTRGKWQNHRNAKGTWFFVADSHLQWVFAAPRFRRKTMTRAHWERFFFDGRNAMGTRFPFRDSSKNAECDFDFQSTDSGPKYVN